MMNQKYLNLKRRILYVRAFALENGVDNNIREYIDRIVSKLDAIYANNGDLSSIELQISSLEDTVIPSDRNIEN